MTGTDNGNELIGDCCVIHVICDHVCMCGIFVITSFASRPSQAEA